MILLCSDIGAFIWRGTPRPPMATPLVTANFPQSVPVKEFKKSASIWRRYKRKFGGMFFWLAVYMTLPLMIDEYWRIVFNFIFAYHVIFLTFFIFPCTFWVRFHNKYITSFQVLQVQTRSAAYPCLFLLSLFTWFCTKYFVFSLWCSHNYCVSLSAQLPSCKFVQYT